MRQRSPSWLGQALGWLVRVAEDLKAGPGRHLYLGECVSGPVRVGYRVEVTSLEESVAFRRGVAPVRRP